MSDPTYQPGVGGENRTGYIKTLIKSKDLIKDMEKMEFLSRVLTDPQLIFYTSPPDTTNEVDQNYKVVLEKREK